MEMEGYWTQLVCARFDLMIDDQPDEKLELAGKKVKLLSTFLGKSLGTGKCLETIWEVRNVMRPLFAGAIGQISGRKVMGDDKEVCLTFS